MGKFRKRPVVVEAVRLLGVEGDSREPGFDVLLEGPIPSWLASALAKDIGEVGGAWVMHDSLFIGTLEGTIRANAGDFIVKGVAGELYPVKPEVFSQTYDKAA